VESLVARNAKQTDVFVFLVPKVFISVVVEMKWTSVCFAYFTVTSAGKKNPFSEREPLRRMDVCTIKRAFSFCFS
jgi:hypothetical protein